MNGISKAVDVCRKPRTSVGCARLLQARCPSRMLHDMVDVMPICDLSSAGKMSLR